MTDRLVIGDPAPDFTLTSDTGEEVTLSDLRDRKVVGEYTGMALPEIMKVIAGEKSPDDGGSQRGAA